MPVARFVAATNVNDVVPQYLATGKYEPRASLHTIANAMDVGNPSNFERMQWLYGCDLEAMRKDVSSSVHQDVEVKATIKDVFDRTGYLLDPHSAIGYLGLTKGQSAQGKGQGIFLATAHPAKFSEIVEPVIGKTIDRPAALAEALARPRQILRLDATLSAIKGAVGG